MPPLSLSSRPVKPDYSTDAGWLVKPKTITNKFDVFYVYPTVLFNDSDWLMDTTKPEMRALAMVTINTQAAVFKDNANIYAPMYRQMNLASLSLSDADGAPLQKIVHEDVWRALKHYLKYENKGRPFFLAGHSQGSMIITDLLLDHWGTIGSEDLLVAAYLLGWSMTSDDLATKDSLQMCKDRLQTQCIISYNSMAKGRQSVAPTLKKNALAVNPLSWTMDDDFVPAEKNIGSVFFDNKSNPTIYSHFTSAQIVNGGLIVQPKDVVLVTVQGGRFPKGIYHSFDYSLFFENIRANIIERMDSFTKKVSIRDS